MKTKNTLRDVLSVLNFTCVLFTLAIIGSYFGKLAQGNSSLPLTLIGQLLVYTLILALGAILCFTDLILRTKFVTPRIMCVGAAVYAISLIYLMGCSFNPLKNPAIFVTYTFLFITLAFGIAQVFIIHQKHREARYNQCIAKFQNRPDGE